MPAQKGHQVMLGKESKWCDKPLRIVEVASGFREDIEEASPTEELAWKKQLCGNVEHLPCMGIPGGMDDKNLFFRSKLGKKTKRDYLGEYLPLARKAGIRTIIYFNVHWYRKQFIDEHPDWVQRDAANERIRSSYGGDGALVCVNTPWRDWSFAVIRDLAQYAIAGIFLDGPFVAAAGCYCSCCREKFKKAYGENLPAKGDPKELIWRNFLDFRCQSIADYLRDARKCLKALKPEAVIYMNSEGFTPSRIVARDNRRLIKHQDMLGAEGGFIFYGKPMDVPLWKPGSTAKLLETQAAGKPTVVFLCGNHKPWDRNPLTPAETRLLFAETAANGANPWYAVSAGDIDQPGPLGAVEMMRFLEKNSGYYENSVSMARVGLLWSDSTASYYGGDVQISDFAAEEQSGKVGNHTQAFAGYYEALFRAQMPFDVIDECSFGENKLGRYEVIILPNCACLPEGITDKIAEYVNDGGNLVCSFETSLYDEFGAKQSDFQLRELLGIKLAGEYLGPLKYDYLKIDDRNHSLLHEIKQELIPAPTYGINVSLVGATAIVSFLEPRTGRYDSFSSQAKCPAVLTHQFGKGSAIYLAGTFAEHYMCYRLPAYRLILANAVRTLAEPRVILQNAPQTLEVVLREQPDRNRILIHLINFSGEMSRPIERVMPCPEVKVTLKDVPNVKAVRALWQAGSLTFRAHEGAISFTVSVAEEYEVVVVESDARVPRRPGSGGDVLNRGAQGTARPTLR